jgi:hypothetical protein
VKITTPTDGSSRLERAAELEERLRAERVANVGAVDRDLGDALSGLVDDVVVVAGPLPIH